MPSLFLGPLMVGEWFVPSYTCAGREGVSLITHISINTSIFLWNGLVGLGG